MPSAHIQFSLSHPGFFFFFFFNDTATTEIYTLSLHDALPIHTSLTGSNWPGPPSTFPSAVRSEEHTSELQSHVTIVCRLLLEKKKNLTYLADKLTGLRRGQQQTAQAGPC